MNNLAYLFDQEEKQTGISMVNVPAYKTSDGKIFNSKSDAEKHEAEEHLIHTLVRNLNRGPNRICGTTLRGYGEEWVPARISDVEQYTRNIISYLKQNNLLK